MCRRPNLTVVYADGYFVKNNLRYEKLVCYKIPIGITIQYKSQHDGYLRIFNQLGSLVMTAQLSKSANKTLLNIADIAKGVYQYTIDFEGSPKKTGKLTILK